MPADPQFGRRTDLQVVSIEAVRQMMMDENISTFDDASRAKLAEKLGADSFVAVSIGHSGSENSAGAVAVPIGNSFFISESSVAEGSVQVEILAASDGAVLASATGHGKSGFRTPVKVLAKTFDEILIKIFPRAK